MVVRPPLLVALAGAALVAACSGSPQSGGTKTVFVDPSTPVTSSGSGSTSTTPSVVPSASLSTPADPSELGGQCDGKLPLRIVAKAVGEDLKGKTAFIVGEPDPSIKRLGYINCKYGLANLDANPTVEIQVSLYGSDAQAAARITPTVTDYKSNGATAKSLTVAGEPATVLTGGSGAGYANTTLVMAFGRRTVAVGVSDDIAADKQQADLTALAVVALNRTA